MHHTVTQLEEAARSAVARGAPGGGAAYLRRALQEPPSGREKGWTAGSAGFAELQLGDPAALAHLEEALVLTTDPRQRVDIAKTLTMLLTLGGRAEDTLPMIDAVTEELRGDDPAMAKVVDRS